MLLAADLCAGAEIAEFRTIDGHCNNLNYPDWGASDIQLLRQTTVEYADGISEPAGGADGGGRPNPRAISNRVLDQPASIEDERLMTSFVFQWGQFLDHDLDLTDAHTAPAPEPFSIMVPDNDPDLLPGVVIPLMRSRYDQSQPIDAENPRQQINEITSYIDASNIYGSDATRAAALRTGQLGKLLVNDQNDAYDGSMLPKNYAGMPNAGPGPYAPEDYYLSGDVRANEQPGLTAMHTLFMREHNRLAEEIAARDFSAEELSDPALAAEVDEAIYQQARQLVIAQIQAITYNEFLPALLGPNGVDSYQGYDMEVNPSISNIFSGALYRFGHTMLPEQLMLLDMSGQPHQDVTIDLGHYGSIDIEEGAIDLASAFFQPSIVATLGIEPVLMGLAKQTSQAVDAKLNDAARNMLFAPPAQFDLGAINIQRGRDHGLPDYNQARRDFGLPSQRAFRQISSDRETAIALAQAYNRDIDNIDVWLGAIAEDHIVGGSVGELVHAALVDQFSRTREGDRYWYENILSDELIGEINSTKLSDIVVRNTAIDTIQENVFRDESVFTYYLDSSPVADITLQIAGEDLQVVDSASGQLLASTQAASVASVVLLGSTADEQISISSTIEQLAAPLEVLGAGGADRLQLIGSNSADRIRIEEASIRFNRATIFYGGIESIEVDSRGGRDHVNGQASSVPLVLAGGGGMDILLGSRFDDLLIGGGGRDILVGLQGNDLLLGQQGSDLLIGGAGSDILVGGNGRDMLMTGKDPGDIAIQGNLPAVEDPEDPLWQALDDWQDALARYL